MKSASSATQLASRISQALISASNPTRSWNSSLELTLHRLARRDSLTPSLVARVIDPFLLSHHSLALGFFNWASQQPGFAHDALTYHSILRSLSSSRQFNAIDALLKQVRARKVPLDSSVYGSVIASLIAGKKPIDAFFVFRDLGAGIEGIGPEICNSLLAALASDGSFEYARKVLDEMYSRNVAFTTLGFGMFVWKLCGKSELGVILSLLDEIVGSDSEVNGSIIALLVVHGLCKTSRVSEAFFILDELRSRNCKPDFMAYSIVSEAFRRSDIFGEIDNVLKKKRKLGVAPWSNDYREFILLLVSEKRISEAKELGEAIVKGNFPIESDVLNVLIGSVSAIDTDSALMFFKFMIGKAIFPTQLTLTNLCNNLCKHGETEKLVEAFELLSLHNYFNDSEKYNLKLSFLCQAGRVREAYLVLRVMKTKSFGPDIISYNTLMEACCREDLLKPAKRLWDEMFTSGFSPNFETYNILIRKFSEIGQVEEARRLFGHMSEKGLARNSATYTFLLRGLCREAKFEDALEVVNEAVERDSELGRNVLNSYVQCLCKGGFFMAASDLFRRLDPGIAALESHMMMLKYLVNASEVSLAIQHIRYLAQTSPSVLPAVSCQLSASLSSSLKHEPILQLLEAMRDMKCLDNLSS